jgi:hypothetical protein
MVKQSAFRFLFSDPAIREIDLPQVIAKRVHGCRVPEREKMIGGILYANLAFVRGVSGGDQ